MMEKVTDQFIKESKVFKVIYCKLENAEDQRFSIVRLCEIIMKLFMALVKFSALSRMLFHKSWKIRSMLT